MLQSLNKTTVISQGCIFSKDLHNWLLLLFCDKNNCSFYNMRFTIENGWTIQHIMHNQRRKFRLMKHEKTNNYNRNIYLIRSSTCPYQDIIFMIVSNTCQIQFGRCKEKNLAILLHCFILFILLHRDKTCIHVML